MQLCRVTYPELVMFYCDVKPFSLCVSVDHVEMLYVHTLIYIFFYLIKLC